MQYVFLELPKYAAGEAPQTVVEKWAYFFREADNLEVIPPGLQEVPYTEALEIARVSGFSEGEWNAYDRALMAEQDARGALQLAHRLGQEAGHREGRDEGRREGLLEAIATACTLLDVELTAAQQAWLTRATAEQLQALLSRLRTERRFDSKTT